MSWILVLAVVICFLYFLGFVPYTDRWNMRLFHDYYMAMIAARSMEDLHAAEQTYMTPAVRDFVAANFEWVQSSFPSDLLQFKIESLRGAFRPPEPP